MIMTGKITFVESEGNLKPVKRDAKTNPHEPCTDAKKQAVKAQIASYINASPKAETGGACQGQHAEEQEAPQERQPLQLEVGRSAPLTPAGLSL